MCSEHKYTKIVSDGKQFPFAHYNKYNNYTLHMNLKPNEFNRFAVSQGISSATLHRYSSHVSKQPRAEYLTPTIVEEHLNNISIMDVFSRLMMERIIFLGSEINEDVANIVCAQLLFLDANDEKDISLYINSPGGLVYHGNGILDVMDFVNNDVSTLCVGLAASMATIILSNGTKGKRSALKRSRIMIHQPLGGVGGQASDIAIEAKEILLLKKELATTLADNSNQKYAKVVKDMDRDKWFSAKEAEAYGIVDKIVAKNETPTE